MQSAQSTPESMQESIKMSEASKDLESGLQGLPMVLSRARTTFSRAYTSGLSSGMPVTFKDVTYSVRNSQNRKQTLDLLHKVGGYMLPGDLVALMGPSGSGKTTLLDLLAGRKTVGKVQGDIAFAGLHPTPQFLRRFTGYVEQFDTLLDSLTVREMLMYQAELKRPATESQEAKAAVVQELIDVLGLEQCRNVRIGNPLRRGISGGQAKRVSIGIALVTNPRVLFLDEPTTGLDSCTANEVMTVVKNLSVNDITICATIHSPTPSCFNLFDRLILLLRGQCVYFGDCGMPAIDYFIRQSPGLEPLGEREAEAEWITNLITHADREGHADAFAAAYARSNLKAAADAEIARQLACAANLDPDTKRDLAVKRSTIVPASKALAILFKYRTSKNYRSLDFMLARVGDKLVFALIIISMFFGIGDRYTPINILVVSSFLFMTVMLPGYNAAIYAPSIVLERQLYFRELSDGLYQTGTYLLWKFAEEFIVGLFNSIVFSSIVFYAVNLQGSFVLFWLVYLVALTIGIAMGHFFAGIAPNIDVANVVIPTFVTLMALVGGCFIRWDDIPQGWRWLGWLNFLHYAFGALMNNQYAGSRNVQFVYSLTVLDFYSLETFSTWQWLGIMTAFIPAFMLLAFLSIKYLRFVQR